MVTRRRLESARLRVNRERALAPLVPLRVRRLGGALPLALVAVAIVGVLIVSSHFSSSQQWKLGMAAMGELGAGIASESAANEWFQAVVPEGLDSLGIGQAGPPSTVTDERGEAVSRVIRLQSNLFLLVTRSARGTPHFEGGAERRVGILFRLRAIPDPTDTTRVIRIPVRVRDRAWTQLW